MLRAALLLFSGNMVFAVANVLRTVLLARLLPLEDFGIAATFSILMTALSMAFGFGLGQFLIQAKEGDEPRFQAALQGLQAGYGALLFGAVLILGGAYGSLMNMPDATWAYQLMAGLALFIGFVHLDVYRHQRSSQFLSLALYQTLPILLSLLTIWPLFKIFGDWRVMPFALLVQGVAGLVLSHLRAERPYRLAYDRDFARRGLIFGGPLLGNALLLFVITSGDRIIISNRFGFAELAWFSAAFMVTLVPTNMLINNVQNILLPRLSRAAETPQRQAELVQITCQAYALAGAITALLFAFLAEPVLLVLFGADFAQAAPILALLAVMQGLRCVRAAPNVLATAAGRTQLLFYTSLVRTGFIPVAALLIFAFNWPLEALLILGIAGELGAATLAYVLIWHTQTVPLPRLLTPLIGVGLTFLVLVALEFGATPVHPAPWLPVNLLVLIPAPLVLLSVWQMPLLRREIARRLGGVG